MNIDFSKLNLETDIIIDEKKTKITKDLIKIKKGKKTIITIRFNDINTKLKKIFTNELKELLNEEDILDKNALVIGLGNINIESDSLGVKVVNKININKRLSCIKPSVKGVTGIDTFDIINGVVKEINPDFLIVIDSLKTSNINNLCKIIQISNIGITPGSGVNSNNKEINTKTIKKKVITIGVPTVIKMDNLLVSEINIDEITDKISSIISYGVNKNLS